MGSCKKKKCADEESFHFEMMTLLLTERRGNWYDRMKEEMGDELV